MVEECGVLVGAQTDDTWQVSLQRPGSGSAAAVEADWAWALAREETHGDVAGFWHTHPAGMGTAPSPRDVRTLRAWCSALGKPLLCLIADGEALGGYWFEHDEAVGTPAHLVEPVAPGSWIIR